jgi:uridine kinase
MHTEKKPLVIAIAGGSGSGKTTVANAILEKVGKDRIVYIPHDAYYRDLSALSEDERSRVNFDHPDSLESELLIRHIEELKKWHSIQLPIYDFTEHIRTKQTRTISSQLIIMVEGILIFAEPKLRELFDVKIFVDTDSDIRFIRRLERDIAERGRTMPSVIRQYLETVRPMHMDFVEPSKRYADIIIPEGGQNQVALDMVISRIEALLTPFEETK